MGVTDGILHSTVREAGGEDEDVVSSPGVGVDDLLGCLDVGFCVVLELPLAGGQLFWSSPNRRSWSDGGTSQITTGDREEVAGHRNLLLKAIQQCSWFPILARLEVSRAPRQAGSQDGKWRPEVEGVCRLYVRRILAREQGPGVDSLALGEHVRMLLVAGLRRGEPLQGGAVFGCRDSDGDHCLGLAGLRGVESDGQRAAVGFCPGWGEVEFGLFATDCDGGDVEVAGRGSALHRAVM